MAEARECLDVNGNLKIRDFIDEQITDIISELYIHKQMLFQQDRKVESELIEHYRDDLIRLRYLIDDCEIKYNKDKK